MRRIDLYDLRGLLMAVIGIGLDVVAVERLRRALTHPRRGLRFKERVFTETERLYCEGRQRAAESYAARFAAKEAVVKALAGTAIVSMAWQEIEVTNSPDGRPGVLLRGRMAERARRMGVASIHLTLTHDAGIAAAQVLVEGA
jgi:holo-[acyl-carrier protein] synthase